MTDTVIISVDGPPGVGKSLLLRMIAIVTGAAVVYPLPDQPHEVEIVMTDDVRNRLVDEIQRIEAMSTDDW